MNSTTSEPASNKGEDHRNGTNHNHRRKGRRWLAPWKDSVVRPVMYHCVTRVMDRRFAFEQTDKEPSGAR